MKVLKSAQQGAFNMRLADVNSELIEATETGQRAICNECQAGLYSRRRPQSEVDFTWVHLAANNCRYSYDHNDLLNLSNSSISSRMRTSLSGIQRRAVTPLSILVRSNEEILRQLKNEVRLTGCLNKARECLLHAITFKPQTSLSGILAGLKRHLIKNNVTKAELSELNSMTTMTFYFSQRNNNH